MKKTYIKPANTVIRINTEAMIATSVAGVDGLGFGGDSESEGIDAGNARETISAPDVWEEW